MIAVTPPGELVKSHFNTRFVYNSKVKPALVEANLARRVTKNNDTCVKGRTFWGGGPKGNSSVIASDVTDNVSKMSNKTDTNVTKNVCGQELCKASYVDTTGGVDRRTTCQSALTNSASTVGVPPAVKGVVFKKFQRSSGTGSDLKSQSERQIDIQANIKELDNVGDNAKLVYDVNYGGFDDKFATLVIFFNHKKAKIDSNHIDYPIFHLWRDQVDFNFGFVPLQPQVMPSSGLQDSVFSGSFLEAHEVVKLTGKPNFLQARIPIQSQLNVKAWEKALGDYWNRQLLELVKFGFPLDFNRACTLGQYTGNHSSANDFPKDIEAFLIEELAYGAISDRRRVIVDLSWPQGALVNAGIDKLTYLDSEFDLTFPTVDDITTELKQLGRGALLYKVDISRAFRHVKVDPGDYDLLGLAWKGNYESQIFQCLSDAVRFIMHQKGSKSLIILMIMLASASQMLRVRLTSHYLI